MTSTSPRGHADKGSCCGTPFHEISVQTGGSTLSLFRCTSCDRQRWSCDGEPMDREAALARLANAYRRVPEPTKAPAEADASAAPVAPAPRQRKKPVVTLPPAKEPAKKPDELAELLEGWTVLGAHR